MGRRPYHRSRRGPTEEEREERGRCGVCERGLGVGCGDGCAVALWLIGCCLLYLSILIPPPGIH